MTKVKKSIRINIAVDSKVPVIDMEVYDHTDGNQIDIIMSKKQVAEVIRDCAVSYIEEVIEALYDDENFKERLWDALDCMPEDEEIGSIADLSVTIK